MPSLAAHFGSAYWCILHYSPIMSHTHNRVRIAIEIKSNKYSDHFFIRTTWILTFLLVSDSHSMYSLSEWVASKQHKESIDDDTILYLVESNEERTRWKGGQSSDVIATFTCTHRCFNPKNRIDSIILEKKCHGLWIAFSRQLNSNILITSSHQLILFSLAEIELSTRFFFVQNEKEKKEDFISNTIFCFSLFIYEPFHWIQFGISSFEWCANQVAMWLQGKKMVKKAKNNKN